MLVWNPLPVVVCVWTWVRVTTVGCWLVGVLCSHKWDSLEAIPMQFLIGKVRFMTDHGLLSMHHAYITVSDLLDQLQASVCQAPSSFHPSLLFDWHTSSGLNIWWKIHQIGSIVQSSIGFPRLVLDCIAAETGLHKWLALSLLGLAVIVIWKDIFMLLLARWVGRTLLVPYNWLYW